VPELLAGIRFDAVDMEEVVISVLRIYVYDAIDNGYSHHRHEDAGGMKL
jgi:hypothetical protein